MSHSLIEKYRRILDHIYADRLIFYDKSRMDAYILVATLKSNFQRYLDTGETDVKTENQ